MKPSADPIIEVRELRKVYHTPFSRRRVVALDGISFSVERGEIFGFVGPNGAGKTTTIRILMGLIRPSAGGASLFGMAVPSRQARARIGFLPEAPYFYEYLTVGELLDLVGRLFGMDRRARRRRAGELIELVGLERARKQALKSYSKGMLQRAGIAQSLMSDPELVVLDEPTSGLDPLGRREVRQIVQGLNQAGKTVFFSSHILADVEAIADRVAIIVGGKLHDVGRVSELVDGSLVSTALHLRLPADAGAAAEALEPRCRRFDRRGDELELELDPSADVDQILAEARALGARVVSVAPRHESLEDLFVRRARLAGSEGLGRAAPPGRTGSPGSPGSPSSESSAATASSASSAPEPASTGPGEGGAARSAADAAGNGAGARRSAAGDGAHDPDQPRRSGRGAGAT
ncbi:MAG TPA: ABC transporter ATP-binding protein [Kofleriaceae bacterium]|nr:ABC transporter ATP-binding protein [Kofleriaceae bacterium]